MALTKDQILSANDLTAERVDVPEWGGHVFVRMMTAAELLAFHAANQSGDQGDAFGRLAVLTIVDEAGARLFNDDDVHRLRGKSHVAMKRVVDVAIQLNGLSNGAKDELKNA